MLNIIIYLEKSGRLRNVFVQYSKLGYTHLSCFSAIGLSQSCLKMGLSELRRTYMYRIIRNIWVPDVR